MTLAHSKGSKRGIAATVVALLIIAGTVWAQSRFITPAALMQAAKRHADAHRCLYSPVFSPSVSLLGPITVIEIERVKQAGFPVIVWTENDLSSQQMLFDAGVDGIISDRPDLLRQLVLKNRNTRGGLLNDDSTLKIDRFDAQGHRGGRDLRPESTFPAFEAALDNLATTLESDIGITKDEVAVLSHERHINLQTCRDVVENDKSENGKLFIRQFSADEIRNRFVCDKVFRGEHQSNDPLLAPVSIQFVQNRKLPSVFVHPRLQELFAFVRFYQSYYELGEGKLRPDAPARAANAARVRFNLETKIDPRPEFADETVDPETFVRVLAGTIAREHMEARADIQSFDFRTLVITQEQFSNIRTVYLVGSPEQLKRSALPEQFK